MATTPPIVDIPSDSTQAQPSRVTRMVNQLPTTPSIISIPPQIATTIVWVALGFGLAWWLMHKTNQSRKS